MNEASALFQKITGGVKINPENWKKFIENSPDASEIDDRRTADDIKYEKLYDRFQRKEKLTPEEEGWVKSEHLLQQLKNQKSVDEHNRSRGFKVPEARKPRPQE